VSSYADDDDDDDDDDEVDANDNTYNSLLFFISVLSKGT
jgi:hypothetical protein